MTIQDLPKGEFTKVTQDVFRKIIPEVGSDVFHKEYDKFVHPSDEYIAYYIHNGPINNTTTLLLRELAA